MPKWLCEPEIKGKSLTTDTAMRIIMIYTVSEAHLGVINFKYLFRYLLPLHFFVGIVIYKLSTQRNHSKQKYFDFVSHISYYPVLSALIQYNFTLYTMPDNNQW